MNKKRVLVVHYSQTGQLDRIVSSFTQPLVDNEHVEVVFRSLEPLEEYPFPWPIRRFFDLFPECVHEDPGEIKPFEHEDGEYDLVILAYQVWFLSPSLPMQAFLQSHEAQELLKDKPVITLIGCRNMWLMAQEKMKELIASVGGVLIDNVALVDKGSAFETFITTPVWLLTGKKDSFLGLTPAGVADEEIEACDRFGERICKCLDDGYDVRKETMLKGLKAVYIDEKIITTERVAIRSFRLWGKLFRLAGKRGSIKRVPILIIYVIFLITLIITVFPISYTVISIIRRVCKRRIFQLKDYYGQPSGG